MPSPEPPNIRRLIHFGGTELMLDGRRALYLPASRRLIVSDLHLEKASALIRRGELLPRYDSADTLARLQQLIEEYRPAVCICLGDSFHDGRAYQRMEPQAKKQLAALTGFVNQWVWVLGNHDPAMPADLPGDAVSVLDIGAMLLTHEPRMTDKPQIIGHFHPKYSCKIKGRRISRFCFLHYANHLIMPAFGTYTGGLEVGDPAYQAVVGKEAPRIYWLHQEQVFQVRHLP